MDSGDIIPILLRAAPVIGLLWCLARSLRDKTRGSSPS